MNIRLTTVIIIVSMALCNCTTEKHLSTEAAVIHLPACDDHDSAIISVSIDGGESPYIIQVISGNDNTLLFSLNTDDQSIDIPIKDKDLIDYKITIKSSDFQETTNVVQLLPQGKSSLGHRVVIESATGMSPVYNTPVSLYKASQHKMSLVQTAITDSEGLFNFSNLSAGNYYLEVILDDKYNDYKLEAYDKLGRSLVEYGASHTNLMPITCDEALELELMFKK